MMMHSSDDIPMVREQGFKLGPGVETLVKFGMSYVSRFILLTLHYNAEIVVYKPWRPKGFCQFEIIINVLVRSVRFI